MFVLYVHIGISTEIKAHGISLKIGYRGLFINPACAMLLNTRLTSLFLLAGLSSQVRSQQPNIVFLLADDLGYNDIGYHNPAILTPNIDLLASQGVILEQSYVQPMCTPTR